MRLHTNLQENFYVCIFIYIYIYIHMHVYGFVCVCVCDAVVYTSVVRLRVDALV